MRLLGRCIDRTYCRSNQLTTVINDFMAIAGNKKCFVANIKDLLPIPQSKKCEV